MYDKYFHNPPPPISTQIRELRQERELTLSELARRVGTSAATMHRYESGWDRFEVRTLQKIARALDTALEIRLIPMGPEAVPSEQTEEELVASLDPLFWDKDLAAPDLRSHPKWVVARVLRFGTMEQVQSVRVYFGDNAIREAIRRRDVDERTRNLWTLLLNER